MRMTVTLIVIGDMSYKTECEGAKYRERSSASLLTIDFSSRLGQRIKDKYTYKWRKPVDLSGTILTMKLKVTRNIATHGRRQFDLSPVCTTGIVLGIPITSLLLLTGEKVFQIISVITSSWQGEMKKIFWLPRKVAWKPARRLRKKVKPCSVFDYLEKWPENQSKEVEKKSKTVFSETKTHYRRGNHEERQWSIKVRGGCTRIRPAGIICILWQNIHTMFQLTCRMRRFNRECWSCRCSWSREKDWLCQILFW